MMRLLLHLSLLAYVHSLFYSSNHRAWLRTGGGDQIGYHQFYFDYYRHLFKKKIVQHGTVNNRDSMIRMSSGENKDISYIGGNRRILQDYAIILIGLPLASAIFPFFLDSITDPNTFSTDRQLYIIGLLLSKRIFLYWTAFTAFVISARRSTSTANENKLGKRLEQITAEVYEELITMPPPETSETKIIYAQLDKITSTSQAAILPIILSISLVVSYFFLSFGQTSFTDTNGISAKVAFSAFTTLTNMGVAFLFTRTEFRWLFSQTSASTKAASLLANMSAMILTLTAFSFAPGTGLWPIQNIVNFCIAVTMARVLQLPQLSAILLALGGLTAYDFLAVIGSQQFTDGGASIMESVARAKIGIEGSVAPSLNTAIGTDLSHPLSAMISSSSIGALFGDLAERMKAIFSPSSWRPGLFEVAVGGRVSDVLGIADVLFPSLLATWALRFDHRSETVPNSSSFISDQEGKEDTQPEGTPAFSAVCTGFLIGCVLCEVFQTGQGQPALIYIVPAIVSMLGITALQRNLLSDMWAFGSEDYPQLEEDT